MSACRFSASNPKPPPTRRPPGANARSVWTAAFAGPYSRWSYRLGPPIARLHCDAAGRAAHLRQVGQPRRSWSDPLAALQWMAAQLTTPVSPGPPFKGGWVGFLAYDLGRLFETLPTRCADDLQWPLFDFTCHDVLVAHDNLENRSYLITPDNNCDNRSPACTCGASSPANSPSPELVSNFSRLAYEAAVARVIDYIAAGDVFQVNLSQRFSAALPAAPAQIYQRLRQQSPAFSALCWITATMP